MRRYIEHIAYHLKGIALVAICFSLVVHNGYAQYGKVTVKATQVFVSANDTLYASSDFNFTAGTTVINQGAIIGGGAWKNFGTFQERTGIVVLNGGGSNCLQGTSIFNDLTIDKGTGTIDINNGGLLGGDQKIYGVLTLKSGTFDVSSSQPADSVILLSDEIGTARIAEVTGGTFDGSFTMERHIGPAVSEGWRLFSAPVNGTTLSDWNNEIMMTCVGGNHLGPGTHWTSVYTYDETATGTVDVGFSADDDPGPAGVDITDNLTPGQGYMIWVSQSLGQPVTLTADASGTLFNTHNLGNVTIPLTYTPNTTIDDDGWNLIGNPYPCPVEWDDVSLTGNVTNFAYVLDPSTQSYLVKERGTDNYIIASHQGFWVKTTGSIPNPTVTFQENDKSTGIATFYKTQPAEEIKLTLTGYGNKNSSRIRFRSNATYNYDWELDAYKLPSANNEIPNLSSRTNDGKDLQINSIPEDPALFSVPLRISWSGNPPSEPLYQLELVVDNLPTNVPSICLQDLKTGTTVNLVEGDSYSFDASWDPNATDRFMVHGPMSGCATSTPEWLAEQESIVVKEINGFLQIDFLLQDPSPMKIEVSNLLGQNIHTQTGHAHKEILLVKTPNRTGGAYFVTVTTKNLTVTQKVLSGL